MSGGHDFKPSAEAASAQAAAVLEALRGGPRTTTELREMVGCLSPASRVLDLRKAGYRVLTLRRGRQALYSLTEDAS